MAVRPKGSTWFVDFMETGRRVREFGFTSKEEAEAWELEARAAIKRGKELPDGPGQIKRSSQHFDTIQQLRDHVVAVRWSGQKSTSSVDLSALFVRWAGPKETVRDALSTTKVGQYIEHLKSERRAANATINRHTSVIMVLAKAAKNLKLIAELPVTYRHREGQGRLRWFTDDEEKAILSTLKLWSKEAERDLFIFLADTGARAGEVRRLRWADVEKGDRAVTFWITKTDQARTVPLTSRAKEALARRREAARAHDGPFTAIRKDHLFHIWERLRAHHPFLEDAVIHTFRHTCASRLVQRGVDIMRVKTWMGHSAVATTLRYAHLAPKHLDDVLSALEPAPKKVTNEVTNQLVA